MNEIDDWKTVYVGCYTWYEDSSKVDVIEWENNEIKVRYDADDRLDGVDDDLKIYFDYYDISNELFDILSKSIENKNIHKRIKKGRTQSLISSFLYRVDNDYYELIVDENNYVYTITYLDDSCDDIYPLNVIEYLIKGLDKAGYKKINITL